MRTRPRRVVAAALVACACALVGLLVSNLVGGETKIERRIERQHALEDPRFMHELGLLLGPPFVQGNRVRALFNGDEIFPPMLAAIRAAQVSITFETCIYWSGDIGRAFADALAERARQGVAVHVLLDWVGSVKMDASLVTAMVEAGVQVRRFHPPHWSQLGRLNNRTHRKLLVVDGSTGFTGGVGVAPQWTGRAGPHRPGVTRPVTPPSTRFLHALEPEEPAPGRTPGGHPGPQPPDPRPERGPEPAHGARPGDAIDRRGTRPGDRAGRARPRRRHGRHRHAGHRWTGRRTPRPSESRPGRQATVPPRRY